MTMSQHRFQQNQVIEKGILKLTLSFTGLYKLKKKKKIENGPFWVLLDEHLLGFNLCPDTQNQGTKD